MKLLKYWSWRKFLFLSIDCCCFLLKKICKACFNTLQELLFLFRNTRRKHKLLREEHYFLDALFLWDLALRILHTICAADTLYLLFQRPPSALPLPLFFILILHLVLLLPRPWGLQRNRDTALSNRPSLIVTIFHINFWKVLVHTLLLQSLPAHVYSLYDKGHKMGFWTRYLLRQTDPPQQAR